MHSTVSIYCGSFHPRKLIFIWNGLKNTQSSKATTIQNYGYDKWTIHSSSGNIAFGSNKMILWSNFTKIKLKSSDGSNNCIYIVPWECGNLYVWKTKRPLKVRIKEHKVATVRHELTKSSKETVNCKVAKKLVKHNFIGHRRSLS